jgi:predicted RND superfamily exporter protein
MHSSNTHHDPNAFSTRALSAYARLMTRRPLGVLLTLLILTVGATLAATRLTINSNQLDLIDQNLPEVKEVKRVIDMIGGAGHLMIGLRSSDGPKLRAVADDLAAIFKADTENVRAVTYKVPVEFIQKNMVLFIPTEDLAEGKKRLNTYLRARLECEDPFYLDLDSHCEDLKKQDAKLLLKDLIDKHASVGKKSIREDYYVSNDGEMLMILIKPMWDSNELGKTKEYLQRLEAQIQDYAKNNKHGVTMEESYDRQAPGTGKITYGYSGSYKVNVDDSYAIQDSLEPVSVIAFLLILAITIVFFRKWLPTFISVVGMVIGTILVMGFTWIVFRQLNMITSILGGILMGFGVDYGIQFIYRTRIELGMGKRYDQAIFDALVNAGRPAFVAAIVTGGSFLVLMTSEFKGFSQFGLLAGVGTVIIGVTLFCWSPAILMVLGRINPNLPAKLIGVSEPPKDANEHGEIRIPHPKLLLTVAVAVTVLLCAAAIPWTPYVEPADGHTPTLWERVRSGVRFNYNTRALIPENQPSIKLQDEITDRFEISSDILAVYTKTIEEAKEVADELNAHLKDKYDTVEQVVSVYTFVPPPERAAANAKILEEWEQELSDININALPPEMQEKARFFKEVLSVRPYDVHQLPDMYQAQFRNIPTAKPENHGWLTFIYPKVDLRDGKAMLKFCDQVSVIKTDSGKEYRSAGQPLLFGKLARMVLHDGLVTVILAAIWILVMHYLDFRSVALAAASVIPLGVGLVMMLGIMSITNHQLNFMNIIILPILLGFGVSHGLYLLHRFLEGTSPVVALKSVGAAVASSTLTAIAGFGALFAASHNGLKSMGYVACLGLTTTLIVSFTVLAAVLQLIHDRRTKTAASEAAETKTDAQAA